ncbi:MAG TPA: acetate--CoA ligase family protein [Longimicrobiales bacterium]|nr:acetate--CoA ligase family protein [Longimicrobiales bacterium]
MSREPASLHDVSARLVSAARAEGRALLLEPEGMELLAALGVGVPQGMVADGPGGVPDMDEFPGDRVVVKLLSPLVAHRTEVGGVRVVERTPHAVVRALEELERASPDPAARFLVQEFVPHEREPGGELLLSARWSPEFGVVLTLAPGGVAAEALASLARPGAASLVWLAGGGDPGARLERELRTSTLGKLLTGDLRGRAPRVTAGAMAAFAAEFTAAAAQVVPDRFLEVEVNPLVFAGGRPVALDALVRVTPIPEPDSAEPDSAAGRLILQPPGAASAPGRRAALAALLRPATVAVVGASARGANPGRVILRNVLAAGMPASAVTVVKEGVESLEGCRCVPDVASMDPVDVLVVSVAAGEVPSVLEAAVAGAKAKAVVLTSAGLGEGSTEGEAARRVRELLRRPGAPALNGGNCLGIRSLPGRYDTLFIPPEKLGFPDVPPHPVALVTQSGAFAIARTSAVPWLNPNIVVTVGNQLDVTVGEWVEHLVDESGLDVVGCYVEGFKPGDGRRFLEAARAHRAKGRMVVLCRAGRTPAGQDATASHTASMAGDYAVTRALAEDAGVLVAETVDDFNDLLSLAVLLRARRVEGPRAGMVSNAGFECVAMADALGALRRSELAEATKTRIGGILAGARLAEIVAPSNPLDLTPMTGDEAFAAAVAAVLDDPGVDVAVVGCVPLTPALRTLPGDEDVAGPGALAVRLAELWRGTEKAWVISVDAGPRYDPLVAVLTAAGIPVLRRADRATALLARYVRARLER